VHELTGRDIPFWIISAGGKFDVTIKWWSHERYQTVVDHFRGKIQFVQVGDYGHWHPRLEGAIDLRGQTSIRQLIRLVYHSQGILCGVTGLMHLAAAVETKPGMPPVRPCVVIAGAREPAHWEAYPHHQFLQNVGATPCSAHGPCWKARTVPLGDGWLQDEKDHLCEKLVGDLPRCMDLVTVQDVVRAIEVYFAGGALAGLKPAHQRAAQKAINKTATNDYDTQPLTLSSVRLACEAALRNTPPYASGRFKGRGIVIPAGGAKYLPGCWALIRMLRFHGCNLPIEVWHLNEEIDEQFQRLLIEANIKVVNAELLPDAGSRRRLGGWELKALALVQCSFAEALLLDADNVPVRDPSYLFDSEEYASTGAVFWPDHTRDPRADPLWRAVGIVRPRSPEIESGQILVNKLRCWKALCLAMWMNDHSDFFYQHILGDKETFHLAFVRTQTAFSLVQTPVHQLESTMCQHDFQGNRLFQHRNMDKWNLHLLNKRIEGFAWEEECRAAIRGLQKLWDGRTSAVKRVGAIRRRTSALCVHTTIITAPPRAALVGATIRSLHAAGQPLGRLHVFEDCSRSKDRRLRQTENSLRALKQSLRLRKLDYLLFLEDDVLFNHHFWHNLHAWAVAQRRDVALGSFYNPGVRPFAFDVRHHATVVHTRDIFGSQAFLLRRDVLAYIVKHWDEVEGMQDIRISRLAGHVSPHAHYHAPSLVQHVGRVSLWGGTFHSAGDFDANWRA